MFEFLFGSKRLSPFERKSEPKVHSASDMKGSHSQGSRSFERSIALDMIRRSPVLVVPLSILNFAIWGWDGLISSILAAGLISVNFMFSASAVAWGSRSGSGALMGAVLGGFFVRICCVAVAVLLLVRYNWFNVFPFAVSLAVVHVGVLMLEARHISASIAYPGIKPGHSPIIKLGRSPMKPGHSPVSPSSSIQSSESQSSASSLSTLPSASCSEVA